MSTYANTGIELIGTGEQSGTWGDTTNTNLQIVDRLTSGVGTITLSGTTHTLSTTDGVLSDTQYAVLLFSGSPSGTNTVTIQPNDLQRVFFVKNATAQSVVLSQGTGSNVTVPTGKSAVVYTDGSGSGANVVDLTNSFVATDALLSANNLSDVGNASTSRTNLGVAIGSDVQAYDAGLQSISGLTTAADKMIYTTASDTYAVTDITSFGRSLLDDADASAVLTTLGITATVSELNYSDITTLGTSEASKVVTADANGVVTFDNGITEESTVVTSSSNAATLNMRDGTNFTHTLSENVTYTFSNAASSGYVSSFTLKVIQDSTARTITWPGSVDWASATAPTLTTTSGGVDVFCFITYDGGTNWYGFTAGQAMG